jgi:hypothetical protein
MKPFALQKISACAFLITVIAIPLCAIATQGQPTIVPLAQIGGASHAIATNDGLICAGMGPNLVILALPNEQWMPLASLPIGDVVRGLAVDGRIAYIAAGAAGLRIVSLADPSAPVEISALPQVAPATAVALGEGFAYVGTSTGEITAIDISEPANPVITQQIELATEFAPEPEVVNLSINGSHAYVAAGKGALRVLSLANGAQPAEVGAYYLVYEALDVAISGTYAYVASDDGLLVLDVSSPEQPTLLTSEPIGDGTARAVAVLDRAGDGQTYVYIAAQSGGLRIMEVPSSGYPTEIGAYATPALDARDVVINDSQLYIADGAGGLEAVAVSAPRTPRQIAAHAILGHAEDATAWDNHIYVAGGNPGLYSLSYQSGQLALLDGLDTPGVAFSVSVYDGMAFVADGEGGLCIVSVANPRQLRQIASLQGPGIANEVVVQQGYAYVAASEAGLWIVAVEDPDAPYTVGTVALPGGEALGVAVSDQYAYVAAGAGDLRVISIADPANAEEASEPIRTPGVATRVAIGEAAAYVTDSELGVVMVDISNPERPTVAGVGHVAGTAQDVAVVGDRAYVASATAGLQVLSFADPTLPQQVASAFVPGSCAGVQLDEASNRMLVAARDGGLSVLGSQLQHHVYLPTVRKDQ